MAENQKVEEENQEEQPKKPFPKLIVFIIVGMIIVNIGAATR